MLKKLQAKLTLLHTLNEHLICCCKYGSTTYETTTEHSDIDMVCIVEDIIEWNKIYQCKIDNLDIQYMTLNQFKELLNEHHILALETYFYNYDILKEYIPSFEVDNWKLRQSISSVASNAWAKANKKMSVVKDYDIYKGKKSLFHSLRVLMFGIQIAEHQKIVDFKEASSLWNSIYENESKDWINYKTEYKPLYNKLKSQLTKLCPKPI